ncbi:DUF5994 family protein [Prescottella agglutinans]|uniref:DUF5994 family protein n=1 Tax=Prescottella agglutinans TaxID=1644129 RepID=UPI003D98A7A3
MTRTPARFSLRRENRSPDGGQPFSAPTRITRLLLAARCDNDVNGAWWPRTQNITVELHDLVVALTGRLGPVARIHFEWNAVSSRQRQIDPDDGLTVSGLEPDQPRGVMRVYGRNGSRADIAVIDPGLDTAHGYQLMRRHVDQRAPATEEE